MIVISTIACQQPFLNTFKANYNIQTIKVDFLDDIL